MKIDKVINLEMQSLLPLQKYEIEKQEKKETKQQIEWTSNRAAAVLKHAALNEY